MKIPCPDPQSPYVRADVINEKGEQYRVTSGGGITVEVEDNIVEAILTSYGPKGDSEQHAWSRSDGVQTMKLFLENKKLREKVKEYEDKQKRQAREKKVEEVPSTDRVQRSKGKG